MRNYDAAGKPDWTKIGQPKWYDCKLGCMGDKKLSLLTGVSVSRIRYRRELFNISAWTVSLAIAPHRASLGVLSDSAVGRLSGVSASSVKAYREAQGIALRETFVPRPRIPAEHPVRPLRSLLGWVEDKVLADLAGVSVNEIERLREILGISPAQPTARLSPKPTLLDYCGPLLGYESLFQEMSDVRICRATGVPLRVIEARRRFLAIEPFKRTSKLAQYEHLLLIESIPSTVLAKLVQLSATRVSELRRKRCAAAKNGKSFSYR